MASGWDVRGRSWSRFQAVAAARADGAPRIGGEAAPWDLRRRGVDHLAGEQGAALVIALTMIAVVAVVLLALMSYTGTSLRATASVRVDRQRFYAADGAVEAAIQNLRNDPDRAYTDATQDCDFSMPAQGAQPAVTVTCTAHSESTRDADDDEEGGIGASAPRYSILTLGRRANQSPSLNTDGFNFFDIDKWLESTGIPGFRENMGEPGLYYRPLIELVDGTAVNDQAVLKGGVFSNSTIVANRGAIRILQDPTRPGEFRARESCTVVSGGKILVDPSAANPNCQVVASPDGDKGYPASEGGYADDGLGSDPLYPSRIDLQGVPAKSPTAGQETCTAGSTLVVLQPGWYDDASKLSNLMRNCKGPDGKGADFWFQPGLYYFDFRNAGGNVACPDGARPHQWCLGDGQVAPHVLGGMPVGPEGGVWDQNPGARTVTTTLTPASSQSNSGWSSGDNARAIDGSEAWATQSCSWFIVWFCDGGASITLSGYQPIPSTATVEEVTLRLKHRESSNKGTRSVTVYPGGGGACLMTPAPPFGSTSTPYSYDAKSCLGTATKINGMQIRYDVNRNDQSGTAYTSYLDGFEVEVKYTNSAPDRFRFPEGCDNTQPGVQFVFGGDSGVRIANGTFNLCAGPPAGKAGQAGFTRQQIAVYGIRPLPPLKASAVDTDGSTRISDADNASVLFDNQVRKTARINYSCAWDLFNNPCPAVIEADPVTLTFPGLATQGQPGGYPAFPANTRIKKVELRASYSTYGHELDWAGTWSNILGDRSPRVQVNTKSSPAEEWRGCGDYVAPPATNDIVLRSTFQLFDWSTWGDSSQDFADVTNCFRSDPNNPSSPVDLQRLKEFEVKWTARDDCGVAFLTVVCSYSEQLDGIELYVTLEPTSPSAQTWLPGSGCIVGLPNYAGGGGAARYAGDVTPTNCPLMKWNSGGPSFNRNDPSVMTSIIGTFYAPGGVLDFAEYGPYCPYLSDRQFLFWKVQTCAGQWYNGFGGLEYAVVDRGIIARHVTIRGLKVSEAWKDKAIIGCDPDREECGGTLRSPRLVELKADVEGKTRVSAWVCYGPVESTGPSGPDRIPIGSTGKYCTGDGAGAPRIVRWNAT